MANRAHRFGRTDEQQQHGEDAARHGGHAQNGQTRRQETEAGGEWEIEKAKQALCRTSSNPLPKPKCSFANQPRKYSRLSSIPVSLLSSGSVRAAAGLRPERRSRGIG